MQLLRPMYYSYAEEEESYEYLHQYMFGDYLMVSPVTTQAQIQNSYENATTAWTLTEQNVWIPPGNWIEWFSGKLFVGPQEVWMPIIRSLTSYREFACFFSFSFRFLASSVFFFFFCFSFASSSSDCELDCAELLAGGDSHLCTGWRCDSAESSLCCTNSRYAFLFLLLLPFSYLM